MTTSQLDFTNESQEVSRFPAGDHKASINRRARKHNKKQDRNNINDQQKKHRLGMVSKNILLECLDRFHLLSVAKLTPHLPINLQHVHQLSHICLSISYLLPNYPHICLSISYLLPIKLLIYLYLSFSQPVHQQTQNLPVHLLFVHQLTPHLPIHLLFVPPTNPISTSTHPSYSPTNPTSAC